MADAVAVNVVHAVGADVVFTQQGFFAWVDGAEADVDEFGGGEGVLGGEPTEDVGTGFFG